MISREYAACMTHGWRSLVRVVPIKFGLSIDILGVLDGRQKKKKKKGNDETRKRPEALN